MIDLLLGGRGSGFRDTGGNMETEQSGICGGRSVMLHATLRFGCRV